MNDQHRYVSKHEAHLVCGSREADIRNSIRNIKEALDLLKIATGPEEMVPYLTATRAIESIIARKLRLLEKCKGREGSSSQHGHPVLPGNLATPGQQAYPAYQGPRAETNDGLGASGAGEPPQHSGTLHSKHRPGFKVLVRLGRTRLNAIERD